MFNNDFYPTPKNIIELMMQGLEIQGKNFLEPSAGSGNIVKYLNENGAKQVCAFEIEPKLQKILQGEAKLLGDDFLKCTAEQVSHVHYIVMNPPFSSAEKHILHAWDIAPEGCEVIALCNAETLRKDYYSESRKRLRKIIEDYGNEALLLSDKYQQFTEVEEEVLVSRRPKKYETKLVGRIHWKEDFVDEDTGDVITIDRKRIVRVNREWL